MAKLDEAPPWQATLTVLTGTVVVVVVIGGLYWAQTVLIPVALALFLAFPLVSVVTALQRWHLGRKVSVGVVTMLVALFLGGTVWMVQVELADLARELPTYTENIKGKVKYLRQMDYGVNIVGLGKLTNDIAVEWGKEPESPKGEADPTAQSVREVPEELPAKEVPLESPAPVAVAQADIPTWLSQLLGFFSPVLASLSSFALVVVLLIFMLLEHESLRNRFIRLVGNGRMTATTKALDDASGRIGRYLLMQLLVNGSYGIAWSIGLFLIGVDYALLWGFMAAILRYIPYVGPPIAALLPITLSLAQFPGWWQPITVIVFFLVLELISNNAIEPWLYGQSIGVSAVAMIVSAAFWTFLWGPIGLVLSGPLTVCLVVLGKHVPMLEFFVVILGDEPVMAPDMSYYQRLLARDHNEASQLVLMQTKASSPEQVYDELLVPALINTRQDRDADELSDADEEFVYQATLQILEDLGERQSAAMLAVTKDTSAEDVQAPLSRVRLLAYPGRDSADKIAIDMLCQLINPAQWDVEVMALETLTDELVSHVTEESSTIICIGALPPGGLAHTCSLCKQVRAHHPKLKIIVGRWGLKDNMDANRKQLQKAGADLMATTLLETRKQLNDWLPVPE